MLNRAAGLDPEDFDITDVPAEDGRSLARRVALQVLYEADAAQRRPDTVMARHLNERQPAEEIAQLIQQLVDGVYTHYSAIDDVVAELAPEFPLDQVAVVDRNILRIAIYEFAVSRRAPVGAAIDEAVELAKIFGGDGSPAFINGVLGALADAPDKMATLYVPPPAEAQTKEN
jgi:N utilization substance protein B